jgi:outer membrane protein assembly factor BamB
MPEIGNPKSEIENSEKFSILNFQFSITMPAMRLYRFLLLLLLGTLCAPTVFGQQRRPRIQTVLAGRLALTPVVLPRAWEYLTADVVRWKPTASATAVFYALSDGRVVALSLSDGKLLWETAPGLATSAPPTLDGDELIVGAEREQDGTKVGIARVLDAATGVVKRTIDLPASLTSELVAAGGGAFLARLGERGLALLEAKTLAVKWKADGPFSGVPCVEGGQVFVGTSEGMFFAFELADGKKRWERRLEGTVGAPACDAKRVYVGTSLGKFHALDRVTGKVVWERPTGASVQAAPLVIGNRLLVASYDNFLYAYDPGGGEMLWRQMMAGRLTFEPLALNPGTVAVAAFDSDEITVVQVADGRVTARWVVADERIFAGLVARNGLVVVPVERGATAVRF